MPCSRSLLNKISLFLTCLMLVLVVMCPIALAADNPPDGIEITTSPFSFSGTSYATYYVPAEGIESITFSGLYGFSSVKGWNGFNWVDVNVGSVADSVTFSPADYPEYSAFSPVMGSTAAVRDTVVTFERISPMRRVVGSVLDFSAGMFDVGSQLVSWIMSHPLACVTIGLFVLIALIGGILRLVIF